MTMKKVAFNNMIGKGWDSAPQESFCWQKFYENGASTDYKTNQFWWVPTVWEIHGHAHNWDEHTRRDDGRFLKFPAAEKPGSGEDSTKDTEASLASRLLCLATLFSKEQSDKAEELIRVAKMLGNGKIVL